MSGYTPVFNTVFEGSLCGRYPDTAAWMFFLALADWRGEVDKTPEFIAGVTGMPLADLMGCIERFTRPDPRSRSQAEEGRKLVLIDSSRDWGWRVVNIGIYRKKAGGQDQVSDGRNAEKVRRYKDRHRKTPSDTAGHSGTGTHTAYSNTYSNKEKKEEGALARNPPPDGLDEQAWKRWEAYRREIRKPIKPASVLAAQQKLAGFGTSQNAVVEQTIANGWQGLFELKADGMGGGSASRKTRYEQLVG